MRFLFLLTLPWLFFSGCSVLNTYTTDGNLPITGIATEVVIHRDEKGMAYIRADNLEDALTAQGFVTAQDRLFQMELIRMIASGRISELAGEPAKKLDIQMRTIGFARQARKHADILSDDTRQLLQKYIDGVNAYIEQRSDSHHLEFSLAGISPAPWDISDSLAILYFMSWRSSANIKTEIITQMLTEKIGPKRAREIFPLNLNPDDPNAGEIVTAENLQPTPHMGFQLNGALRSFLADGSYQIGSNNWAVAPERSPSRMPIVANDPHLDARILPGPWYPCGLILPQFRAVGAGIPGIPGMVVFRTSFIAAGVTNAYADSQDLYIETPDPENPDHYLEGTISCPFEKITEILKIKDKDAPNGMREEKLTIRKTRRGPVISECMPDLKTDRIVTLRWAPFESMQPTLGMERMITARSAGEFRQIISSLPIILLNFVFADTEGNIGWQVSGKIPIRSQGDASVPYVVTGTVDNWHGWIPQDEMPGHLNPSKGWTGTCNHNVITCDYPYYYSSYLSPAYRYRRLKELLDPHSIKSAEDHWQMQRDTLNLMAKTIAPLMAAALRNHQDTREIGEILTQWDFHDTLPQAAPTIFQSIYREFAASVFQDELGEDLSGTMLNTWYFWQERLQQMVIVGDSPWFDDIGTPNHTETRDELFVLAARKAIHSLSDAYGKDPKSWHWEKAHQIEFVSPLRRKGFGKGLLGGGSHPAPGSGETLYRGLYRFDQPFGVTVSASLRMVADLGDPDKILAVLPGGVSGRLFHPHTKDQVEAFMSGENRYWWFSDQAIRDHTHSSLVLIPERNPQ